MGPKPQSLQGPPGQRAAGAGRRPASPRGQAPEAAGRSGRGQPPEQRCGLGGSQRRRLASGGAGGGHKRHRGARVGEGSPRDACRRGTLAHRASVLNDDLLGQHDTAVRGPFLLLSLGHFTILDAWRCCSHSRGGRPQRRVPSRHYCGAEPLGAPAAILRARPASGGASHRAIGRRARRAPPRPAHVTPVPAGSPAPRCPDWGRELAPSAQRSRGSLTQRRMHFS